MLFRSEITAPTGFVLSGKVKTVELTYAGQDVKVTSTATEFTNLRQKVEIELKKGLEIDELYGIGTNGEIFDISFGLYAAEKLTAADGKIIPKDGLIEILFLSDEGRSKAKTDLPIGNYYVKEIAANSAYVVGNTKFPVNFAYAGQEKATVSLKVNDGNSIANKIITAASGAKRPTRTATRWAARSSGFSRSARRNIPKRPPFRPRLPRRTAALALKKCRMAHGLSVKSRLRPVLYCPRKNFP